MGTMTGQQIFNRVGIVLQDKAHTRWPVDSELLLWLNDGQREIVNFRPDANTITAPLTLLANSSKQELPAAAIRLVDIVRNLGSDGFTPGKMIRLASRMSLDSHVPDWHRARAAAEVKHYVFDPITPKIFWIYPRVASPMKVEVQYSAAPADVTSASRPITLDDMYANALIDYILHRCYAKDADDTRSDNAAVLHYQAFQNALGVRTQNDGAMNPNARGAR